ncbi:putative alcohol dehydrogenase [Rosellinia necatrix]|uniref:Putative alcohol dehydrogenase n=1 Tax=Rosellinia necatrix TaxID=77044 RepID=A0A1W2TMG4_ROSNE|nr:putative alcohol dehydrogenase [Rosellinia necatrix]
MAGAKALVVQSLKSPADVKVVEKDIPKAAPGTAVVQVLASGIGPGHGYLISHEVPGFSFPLPSVYGTSAVGRVVSVGSDSVSLKEGQLVAVDPFTAARDDPDVEIIVGLMDSGETKARKLANDTWRDGCWQTHAVIPLENVIPLDEDALIGKHGYDIEELTIIIRLAVAYGAISGVDIKAGETVIVGPATGQFGGAAVEVASAIGARVIALGRNREALDTLKSTIPRVETVVLTGDVEKDAQAIQAFGQADAFVDFTPHSVHTEPSHIKSAMFSLRKRGRVALMGGLGGNITLPYFLMILKSLEIKGKWMYTRSEVRNLVKMIEAGTLKIGKGAGHQVHGKFRLEDYEAAFESAAKNANWGASVVFTP